MSAAALSALKVLLLAAVGGNGLPFGIPPAADDVLLARVAPEECLLYAAWSGSAEPSATSGNSTERLLAEPEVQHLLSEVNRLIDSALERSRADAPSDLDRFQLELTTTWGRRLIAHPTAIFLERLDVSGRVPIVRGGLVSNLEGDAAEAAKALASLREMLPAGVVTEVTIDGVAMHRMKTEPAAPAVTFGLRGTYLIVGVGDEAVEGIAKRVRSEPPAWLAALVKRLPVERRSLVKYVNVQGMLAVAEVNPEAAFMVASLKALGLANVQTLSAVAGLDGAEFVTRVHLQTDGKPAGLLSLAGGAPLSANDLAPIPHDATVALAGRLDATGAIDVLRGTIGRVNPEFPAAFDRDFGRLEEEIGVRLRADLLGSLGDVWCAYHSPGEGGLLLGMAAVVKVKDRARLTGTVDRLIEELKRKAEGNPYAPRLAVEEFRGHKIYFASVIDDDVPVAPALCITDDAAIVALYPQTIRAYLSRGDDFQSLAAQPAVALALAVGKGPTMLAYQDTPRLLELAYPFVQIGVRAVLGELQEEGLDVDDTLLPSLQSLRRHLRPGASAVYSGDDGLEIVSRHSIPAVGGAPWLTATAVLTEGRAFEDLAEGLAMAIFPGRVRETQSMNNLRQIALAMHNYHDSTGKFPAAFSSAGDKPLLSWRVHILPYIEQDVLYREFRLDEPWDSEHNKKLVPRMPQVYLAPGANVAAGHTNYLTAREKGTIFPGKDALGMASIADGVSNTILVVEAADAKAVPWTKPDDYAFDPMNPSRGLAGLRGDSILSAFADGSVHRLSKDLDPEMFRRLFQRDDGQPVDFERR